RRSALADGYRLRLTNRLELAAVDTAFAQVHLKFGRPCQRTLDQSLAERILNILLERSPQRPRAIAAVRAGLVQNVLGGVLVDVNLDLLRDQILVDLLGQQ